VLAHTSVVNSGLVSIARPSNRVCGEAVGACEREERPSAICQNSTLVKMAGASRRGKGETHLRMGKARRLSSIHGVTTELLDRERGPCAGIPS
jgi:hypothetical protein